MSLFNEDDKSTQTPSQAQGVDELLDAIKNDSGQRKYANAEEAVKALKHSQEYIPTLKQKLEEAERRAAEAEAKAQEAARLEDIITKLTAGDQNLNSPDTPQVAAGLSEEAVKELVKNALGETESQRKARSNLDLVEASIVAKFGDKAGEVVTKRASELGLSKAKLEELSSQNPDVVLALFQAPPAKSTTTFQSSVNIPPINPPKTEFKRPDKSVLTGASSKEQIDHFNSLKESVFAQLGITT